MRKAVNEKFTQNLDIKIISNMNIDLKLRRPVADDCSTRT